MAIFERYFSRYDFGMLLASTDVVLPINKYTEVGSYQVGAKQIVAFGAGEIANGVDSRRTASIDLQDTSSATIPGKCRLCVADANLIQVVPVVEDLLSNWTAGVKLARQALRAGEDGYLKIQVIPDAAATLDMSDTGSVVNIPVTVQTL